MRKGIIDVGSNSVRINIFADEIVLYEDLETTRLGNGLVDDNKIHCEDAEATLHAIKKFLSISKEYDAKPYIFGTETLRRAENAEDFLKKVKEQTGVDVDVISGEKEGEIGFYGATKGNEESGVLVIDIGGASTELCYKECGKTVSQSLPFGSVLCYRLFGEDKTRAESFLDEKLESVSLQCFDKVIGIGGTVTALASVLSGKEVYDKRTTDGFCIRKNELAGKTDELYKIGLFGREKIPSISKKRAETIAVGSLILLKIIGRINIGEVFSSETDNILGYLKKCAN